jgi:hypothetical protein
MNQKNQILILIEWQLKFSNIDKSHFRTRKGFYSNVRAQHLSATTPVLVP